MKKLSKLGISPTPWKVVDSYQFPEGGEWVSVIESANGKTVSVPKYNNGSLIVAAPKMYEALYKITKEQECGQNCEKCRNSGCVIKECKAALAEASGESEEAK